MIQVRSVTHFGKPFCLEFRDDKNKDDLNVGYVLGTSLGTDLCYIWFIYVRDKYRRKGYGKLIIEHLMGKTPNGKTENKFEGFKIIETEWSASTKTGRQFLLNMGFTHKKDRLVWSSQET